jgi:MFS family permease
VRILQPLRQRDFALLWAGLSVSLIGDGIYFVALPFQAYALDNHPSALALVGVTFSAGMVVALPVAGLASDRLSRKRVLMVSAAARALLMAVVGGLSVAGVLVTFKTTDNSGVLIPALGTALTDSSGVARLGLGVGTQTGAFAASATATVGNTALAGTVNYQVTTPAQSLLPTMTLALTNASGAAISDCSGPHAGLMVATVKDAKGTARSDERLGWKEWGIE